jgi:hypothetical protein
MGVRQEYDVVQYYVFAFFVGGQYSNQFDVAGEYTPIESNRDYNEIVITHLSTVAINNNIL